MIEFWGCVWRMTDGRRKGSEKERERKRWKKEERKES